MLIILKIIELTIMLKSNYNQAHQTEKFVYGVTPHSHFFKEWGLTRSGVVGFLISFLECLMIFQILQHNAIYAAQSVPSPLMCMSGK